MRLLVGLITFSLFFSACQNDRSPDQQPVPEKAVVQVSEALVFPPLPKEMTFAGEKISLQDEDIRERLDRELLMTAYYQSAMIGAFKRAHRFFPAIERILQEEGIPEDFKYLAVIESNLQQAISPVGAQGFWQFMPQTAKLYGLEMSDEIDERLNIEKSTQAACHYLKDAQAVLHDWLLTTASYNRGVAGVQNDMEWQESEHYFDMQQNNETSRYVFRLLATKLIFENPHAYGYYPEKMELYNPFKTRSIIVEASIKNLAEWSIDQGINIKILRKLNPWMKTTHLTVKKGRKYTLLLPASSENLRPYNAYQ